VVVAAVAVAAAVVVVHPVTIMIIYISRGFFCDASRLPCNSRETFMLAVHASI
jgi:hypothetical protein